MRRTAIVIAAVSGMTNLIGMPVTQAGANSETANAAVRGVIVSDRTTPIVNPRRGVSAIVEIAGHGATLTAGDLVCRLDGPPRGDRDKQLQMALAAKESELHALEAEFRAVQQQHGAKRSTLAEELRLAEMDLQGWKDGGFQIERTQLEGVIAVAEARLELMAARMELPAQTTVERLEARVEHTAASSELQVARLKLKYLQDFLHPRKTADLETAVRRSRRHMEQESAAADAELSALKARLEAATHSLELLRERLQQDEAQRTQSTIRAPHDGLLQHGPPIDRGSEGRQLQVGDQIREQQVVATLHDLSRLTVQVRIAEAERDAWVVGTPVHIQVDALPERRFSGTVIRRENDADADGRDLRIRIAETESSRLLRPGMTAEISPGAADAPPEE